MTGLIIKDLFAMKSYLKSLCFIVVFYIIIGLFLGDINFYNSMIMFMSTFSVLTLFSYDKYYKWNIYSVSLPLKRKNIVLAKYISSYCIITVAFLLCTVIDMLNVVIVYSEVPFNIAILIDLMYYILCSLYIGLIIPLIYKFDVEKGRIIMTGLFIIPFLIIMYISSKDESRQVFEGVFKYITEMVNTNISIISIVVILAFIFLIIENIISYIISCFIFNKKEF